MSSIEPKVLVWARETAGLTVDDAAGKVFTGDGAAERLRAVEAGERQPSRAQLLKMAKAYHRSLLTFYLPEPPRRGERGQDFRTLPVEQRTEEPLVDALVRDINVRQSVVKSLLEDDEDAGALPFVASTTIGAGVETVRRSIQEATGFDLAEFRACGTVERAFAYAREKVESLGVFVLLIGNLGSYHTDVDVSSFRGFAIADKLAPFIVINDHDARSAWSFTLFHELAHLWLGATGISGQYGESQLERFCNDVASTLLLRPHELDGLAIDKATDEQAAGRLIGEFASARLISRSMVIYRLLLSKRVTPATWRSLTATFRDDWIASRDAKRAKARQREGGADFYVVRRHRLGRKLLDVVGQGMQAGALTPTKAGLVLGVKPRNVAPLLHPTQAAAS